MFAMAAASDAESTFYPKITTHIPEVVERLQTMHRTSEFTGTESSIRSIPIVGTVKLHGTHADVLVYSNNNIVFQSRNTTGLSAAKDNQGFAAAMSSRTAILLKLRDAYLAQWKKLNAERALDQSLPLIIAGEWIGEKIQKDVAISQLSRRFVIVSININGQWQNDQNHADIDSPEHDIYNISRAGLYHAILYPEEIQHTISETERMAEKVAANCPFAITFGVSGPGEGIVWKPSSTEYNSNANLWFKTKGGKFKPTPYRPPRKPLNAETTEERRTEAANAAKSWCSTQRLEQGWGVMREKSIVRDAQGLGAFLPWVQQDVLIEEKVQIRESGIDEAILKVEIAKIAKPWYRARVRQENGL